MFWNVEVTTIITDSRKNVNQTKNNAQKLI